MICGCGCNQILLECNHVGCPLSDGMRNELTAAIQRGDSDSLILQAFVQKYGPTILAAPTYAGFDRVAWITPFAVLLLAFAVAVAIIRSWKREPLTDGGPTQAKDGLPPHLVQNQDASGAPGLEWGTRIERVRQETEL
jgi:cytochrome c-type biogenesis protein CcmH